MQTAQKTFDTGNDEATLKPLLDGLFAVRVLRRELRTMAIDDAGKFEIDFRLRQKEGEFQQAIAARPRHQDRSAGRRRRGRAGAAGEGDVIVANRGAGGRRRQEGQVQRLRRARPRAR